MKLGAECLKPTFNSISLSSGQLKYGQCEPSSGESNRYVGTNDLFLSEMIAVLSSAGTASVNNVIFSYDTVSRDDVALTVRPRYEPSAFSGTMCGGIWRSADDLLKDPYLEILSSLNVHSQLLFQHEQQYRATGSVAGTVQIAGCLSRLTLIPKVSVVALGDNSIAVDKIEWTVEFIKQGLDGAILEPFCFEQAYVDNFVTVDFNKWSKEPNHIMWHLTHVVCAQHLARFALDRGYNPSSHSSQKLISVPMSDDVRKIGEYAYKYYRFDDNEKGYCMLFISDFFNHSVGLLLALNGDQFTFMVLKSPANVAAQMLFLGETTIRSASRRGGIKVETPRDMYGLTRATSLQIARGAAPVTYKIVPSDNWNCRVAKAEQNRIISTHFNMEPSESTALGNAFASFRDSRRVISSLEEMKKHCEPYPKLP